MAPAVITPCIGAAIAGYASWISYFHRYECHMHGLVYLNTFLVSCAAGFIALTRLYGATFGEASFAVWAVSSSYLFGVYGSMLFWRAFLNPLNQFPGPWPARLSNLYFTFRLAKSDWYLQMEKLHKKHGRIIRVGSNDLSITDPNIMETAYGRNSKVTKGWW